MYAFEHFHYGQLVHHGQPMGENRVLARSKNVQDDLIEATLNHALQYPLPNTNHLAWGILRIGRGMPMVLARAEQGNEGQITHQFIFLTTDALRELAGNLQVLLPVVKKPLPVYETLGDTLPSLRLLSITAPSAEAQVDSLLDLMTYTKNKTRNIEPLLAAVVSGLPLVIKHAPQSPDARAGFVQGILTLLPASTRFAVTFLLHNTAESTVNAQITFMEGEPARESTIFDWASGEITGKQIKTAYSRFIISQLRLDTEVVRQQTEKLTPTAGWRFSSGDSLAEALDYASYRSKMDRSIETHMPVEVASVAKILQEDPTLTDAMRLAYARHLMRFSLALEDISHTHPVATIMHQHPELEAEIFSLFEEAVANDKADLIFELLVEWLQNPLSPHGPKWAKLLQQAALAELQDLIAGRDTESIADYLDDIQQLGSAATPIVATIIDRTLPLVNLGPNLSSRLLLLGIRHLDDTQFHKLLAKRAFVQPLPRAVRRLLAIFTNRDAKPVPGTLLQAVQALSPESFDEAVIQFAKMAYLYDRLVAIDTHVLRELVRIATISRFTAQHETLATIAQAINDKRLIYMGVGAARMVLQILLATKHFDLVAKNVQYQVRHVYRAEKQLEYVRAMQTLFAHTALSAAEAQEALAILERTGIQGIPLIAAMCGVLEGTGWSADVSDIGAQIIDTLLKNPKHLEVIPSQTVMNLLAYYARHNDDHRLRLSVRLLASCNAYKDDRTGLSATHHAYKLLNSYDRTQPVALEVIRQYVREASEKPALHIMNYYSAQLGSEIRHKLQTSYEFANLLGRMDFLTYAAAVRTTVDLLQNAVEMFASKQHIPELFYLRQVVDELRRDTTLALHIDLSKELKQMAHKLVVLAEQHERRSSNSSRHKEQIAEGAQDPKSMLDVFRASGGHLLEKKVYPLRIKQDGNGRPFGQAAPADIVVNITIASNVMHQATIASPTSRSLWSYADLADELDSLCQTLPAAGVRDAIRQLGRDWQRLADLISHIHKESDPHIIEPNNKQGLRLEEHEERPEDVLQWFRFVYGFFEH